MKSKKKVTDIHLVFEYPNANKENFHQLFEAAHQASSIEEGTVVQGEIVSVKNNFVTIDVGSKNEGIVPLQEFGDLDASQLEVGMLVDVFVEKIDSQNGRTILSRDKALKEEYWKVLEKVLDKKETIEGVITGKVKGGFTVDLKGITAFLPGSQVDVRVVKDITPLLGIAQPFQILKIDREQGNIVVSRRAILEESRMEARSELLSQIKKGQVLDGVVKNITDYGAFIDLGNVDGLLHVTDISWHRINHPSELLSLGQQVKVQVIKFDEETKRISLGMKQLEANPWDGIEVKFPKGHKFTGKVTNIADYGAFIELEPGIEGLVHVSEISWIKTNIHPKKLLVVGQDVECMVLDIDSAKHRVSLGMKQCQENPWTAFAAKHNVGDIVEGEIRNIVDFGLFIGFDGDIDGLVHSSDLAWKEGPESDVKSYKKGQVVRAKILAIDPEKERISLGLKQLTEVQADASPRKADSAPKEVASKGDVVTCVVTATNDDGVEVEFGHDLKGFVKKVDLAAEKSDQRSERFAIGEKFDAKIMSTDKAMKKFNLSIKVLEIEEQKKAIAEYGSTDSGASLGDILGAALGESLSSTKKKSAKKEEVVKSSESDEIKSTKKKVKKDEVSE